MRKAAAEMSPALRHPHTKCEFVVAETLRHFWERAIETAAPGCQKRFINSTNCYIKAVCRQVVNRIVALDIIFALVEYGQNLDLGDEVVDDPVIKELSVCANGIVTWANDIYSHSLEQSWGETSNLVVVTMREKGISLQRSIDYVGGITMRRIDHFCQCYLKRKIRSLGPSVDGDVGKYVKGLEDWSFATDRYFGTRNVLVKGTLKVVVLPKQLDATISPKDVGGGGIDLCGLHETNQVVSLALASGISVIAV